MGNANDSKLDNGGGTIHTANGMSTVDLICDYFFTYFLSAFYDDVLHISLAFGLCVAYFESRSMYHVATLNSRRDET